MIIQNVHNALSFLKKEAKRNKLEEQSLNIMIACKVMMKTETDCLKACLATIFDLDYQVIPNFSESKSWLAELADWVKQSGYTMYMYEDQEVLYDILQITENDKIIGVGPSPRIKGKDHAVVVGKDSEIIHYPSPEGTPISYIKYILVFERTNEI
jgi:hypothetical protein